MVQTLKHSDIALSIANIKLNICGYSELNLGGVFSAILHSMGLGSWICE